MTAPLVLVRARVDRTAATPVGLPDLGELEPDDAAALLRCTLLTIPAAAQLAEVTVARIEALVSLGRLRIVHLGTAGRPRLRLVAAELRALTRRDLDGVIVIRGPDGHPTPARP